MLKQVQHDTLFIQKKSGLLARYFFGKIRCYFAGVAGAHPAAEVVVALAAPASSVVEKAVASSFVERSLLQ